MSAISPNEFTILERLEGGPEWIRSFQPAKPLLDRLIERGLVERCRPHLGRARNMVRLTAAGCAALDVDLASVPTERERKAPIAKKLTLGAVRPALSDKVRRVCEIFVRAIKAGEDQADVIANLAAMEDVQRPAIWKRLRMGGVVPEYGKREDGGKGRPVGGGRPGYTAERRKKALETASVRRAEPSPDQYVYRDPCPRCGVRADIGCAHSQARIGWFA